MRVFGIIKWFGNYNLITISKNKHGLITCEGQQGEIYVSQRQVKCSVSALIPEVPVTFEIITNNSSNRQEAINLQLLSDETDLNTLKLCVKSLDKRIWMPALINYIVHSSIDESTLLLTDRVKKMTVYDRNNFISLLSEKILLLPQSQPIREYLSLKQHSDLFIKIQFINEENNDAKNSIKQEIIKRLLTMNIYNASSSVIFSKYISDFIDKEIISLEESVNLINTKLNCQTIKARELIIEHLQNKILFSEHSKSLKNELSNVKRINLCVKEVEEICPQSNLDELKSIKPNLIEEIVEILKSSKENERHLVVSKLPEWLKHHETVFEYLTASDKIDILVFKLNQSEDVENELITIKIVQILSNTRRNKQSLLVSKLPAWLKKHEAVFEYLTASDKISILSSKLKGEEDIENEVIITKIVQILSNTNSNERTLLVNQIPEWLKEHENIFPLLPLYQQIELAYSSLKNGSTSSWKQLRADRKVLCVYRIAKEGENISKILLTLKIFYSSYTEENTFVRYVLKLLWARENPTRSQEAFETAHRLLQDYIVEQAFDSTQPLDLYPLLPNCRPQKVQYCEGKPWATEQDKQLESIKVSRAFCPRTNSACNLFNINSTSLNSNLEGARLYAECSQDYINWSLLELIEVTGVEPRLPTLSKPSEYVQKLSGWVNRLNEIRERLECSTCHQIMTPNFKYSEDRASYSMTVTSCPQGRGHDKDIYFNHCWACREIIDSRESKIRVENYYICIHCGSGRQNSLNYAQGDKCPKCGELRMMPVEGDDRRLVCSSIRCQHQIKLPSAQCLTGTRSFLRQVNRNNLDLPETTDLEDF